MAKGLVLSLGGAPETWHTVDGLTGFFHPRKPVPVQGDPQQLDRDEGVPVRVVTCKQADLDASTQELADLRSRVLRAIGRERDTAPVELIDASLAAIKNDNEE